MRNSEVSLCNIGDKFLVLNCTISQSTLSAMIIVFKLRLGASIIPNVGLSVCLSVENFKITGFRGLTCLNLKTNLARYTN